ncbi:MAG: DMT family transporter [Prevotella sp.]|nr:DMT family transporter [Candidatus Prevotella equi]
MSKDLKGVFLATISGASFGLIPLFTIPVINTGMGYCSIIFYRFLFGSLFMLAFLLYKRESLRISFSELWRISILSSIYIVCAVTLFKSYAYITSGVATSLIYTNPIWCALLAIAFCGEKFSWRVTVALLLSFVGVTMLSGLFDDGQVFSALGIFLGLCSGIGYGVYLILLPRLRLGNVSSLKLTFYIFFTAVILLLFYQLPFEGGIDRIEDWTTFTNLLLVGLLPTAFSNICVTMALRMIDTTIVSILGAFEPFTAMVVGILLLHEPFSLITIIGGLLVLASVTILTIKKK